MIDLGRARRAHETALRALTMYEHAMEELGVPIGDVELAPVDRGRSDVQDADSCPVEAASAPDAGARALATPYRVRDAVSERASRTTAKRCAYAPCGRVFHPHPQGVAKATYCSKQCRQNAAAQRKRDGEAAEDRRQAAAVMEQASRDGFPSTLVWENGRATSAPKR